MAFVSLARARLVADLVSVSDATLTEWINFAEGAVEDYCHTRFTAQSLTDIHDGDGSRTLVLDVAPAQSFSSVVVVDTDGVSTTYTSVELALDLQRSELRFRPTAEGQFDAGFQNVTTSYTAGYGQAPQPVIEAVVRIVARANVQTTSALSTKSERMGDYSITYKDAAASSVDIIAPDVRSLLAPYVDWSRAMA